jgi:hypothetical protein
MMEKPMATAVDLSWTEKPGEQPSIVDDVPLPDDDIPFDFDDSVLEHGEAMNRPALVTMGVDPAAGPDKTVVVDPGFGHSQAAPKPSAKRTVGRKRVP